MAINDKIVLNYDEDKEYIPVDPNVYLIYRTQVLFRKLNIEMVGHFRMQIVKSEYLAPLVQRLCVEFLRTGDLSVTEEEVRTAKIDLQNKSLRVGEHLDYLWELWYSHLCKTVREIEDTLPTINR